MTNETALIQIGPLQQALTLATEAGDLTKMRDVHAMATMLRKGAQARGMGIEAENQAAEVVLRSERAMGALLAAAPREVGRRTDLTTDGNAVTPFQQAMIDAGLTPSTHKSAKTAPKAMAWQRLAAIPDAEFEQRLAGIKGAAERLARVKFIAPKQETEAEAEARRIREYNRSLAAAEGSNASPVFRAFIRAANELLRGMPQLPNDELVQVGIAIRELATSYNEARTARQ